MQDFIGIIFAFNRDADNLADISRDACHPYRHSRCLMPKCRADGILKSNRWCRAHCPESEKRIYAIIMPTSYGRLWSLLFCSALGAKLDQELEYPAKRAGCEAFWPVRCSKPAMAARPGRLFFQRRQRYRGRRQRDQANRPLPSGVYMASLKAGPFMQRRKLLLVR